MSIDPFTALLNVAETTIERIWPDANKRAEEMRKLEEIRQRGDLAELEAYVKITLAQIKVNEIAAQHKSVWVAGARPFILWVGGLAMAYQFLVYPFLTWIWVYQQAIGNVPTDLSPPPIIDPDALWVIVTGLLGIGGMRSYDKSKGTQTDSLQS